MKFGHWYASVGPWAFPEAAASLAKCAEEAGIDSLWTGEHVAVPADHQSTYPYSPDGKMAGGGTAPMAEPMVWHSFIAAHTRAIKLITGVLVLPQREPVLVAKQAATLAVLSGGRLSLGFGVGWLREEFDALGADFSTRSERHDEYIATMQSLWENDKATFDGEFVQFKNLQMSPRPPNGSIPIIIGGHTKAAARRAGRLGDGFFPAKGSPDEVAALFDLAKDTAEAHNRDPEQLELSVQDSRVLDSNQSEAVVAQWRAVGASRIIISPQLFDPPAWEDKLAQFGAEVVSHVS